LTSATGASIRAALGATGPELRSLLLADTLRPLGAGLAVGVCLSWLGAETVVYFCSKSIRSQASSAVLDGNAETRSVRASPTL